MYTPPKTPLEELFFHHNFLIYTAKTRLKQRQEQFDHDVRSLDRLENVLDASEAEIETLTLELHDISFELMLHTPCSKFNKLLGLLDI